MKKFLVGVCNTLVVIIIVAFMGIFIYERINKKIDNSFESRNIYDWSSDWNVFVGDEFDGVMSFPQNLDVPGGQTVIIKKPLPNRIKKYNCLMLESKHQDIKVNVDGILRYTYSDKDTRRFGKNSPSTIVLVPIYTTDEEADITIFVSSDSKYSGDIGNIYLGNERSIILKLIKENMTWLALCFTMALLSIACMVYYIMFRKTMYEGEAFIFIFGISILSTVWCFMQLKVRQIFINDVRLLDNIGYLCFMLLPLFVVAFSNWISKRRYQHICSVGVVLIFANYVVQNIVYVLGIYDFFELSIVSEAIFVLAVVVAVLLNVRILLKEKNDKNALFLLAGYGWLFLCLAGGISFTLLDKEEHSGHIYISGLLIYVILNIVYLASCISIEEQKRKDAESASAAKTNFLATMSHEIRTPINAVLGMNEMILRESQEDRTREYAGNIETAGRSLLSLVNDILDFSKIESGKMDIVCVEYSMKYLIRDLILMTQSRMNNTALTLNLDIDESIPAQYFGDEVRIKQILTNILTNSVKYTREGSINFTVRNCGIADDTIELLFSVKDTGIGIKEEDIEKIMNSSFVRVDKVKNKEIEGTGLGISITRQLLTLMDSELKIDSVYGEGSEFSFVLKQKIIDTTPMGTVMDRTEAVVKRRGATFIAPKARILAVDDTKTNLLVIKGLLKQYQCQVFTCNSGEECIRLCKNDSFDLILMDHMMPGLDGIETLKILRDGDGIIPQYTKVIALTANAVSGANEIYKEAGFDGYVTKPIDILELDECLKTRLLPELIEDML